MDFSPGSACTLIVVAGGIPGARFIVSVAQSQDHYQIEINYSKNFHYFLSLTRPPYVLIISDSNYKEKQLEYSNCKNNL